MLESRMPSRAVFFPMLAGSINDHPINPIGYRTIPRIVFASRYRQSVFVFWRDAQSAFAIIRCP